jgi:DNA-binding MurR/RpiR family transcriptional regulator
MTQTIEERIKNASLTKTERLIAEYILHNYSTVGFMTSTDIAATLGVSDSSIIRLSRSLGYSGFNDLKTEIKSIMSEQLKSGNEFEYSYLTPIDRFKSNFDNLSTGKTVSKQLDWTINNIKDVLNQNPDYEACSSVHCGMLPYLIVSIMMGASMQYLMDEEKFNLNDYFNAAEKMILNFLK